LTFRLLFSNILSD